MSNFTSNTGQYRLIFPIDSVQKKKSTQTWVTDLDPDFWKDDHLDQYPKRGS